MKFTFLLFSAFLSTTAFAQLSSGKLDSLMQDAIIKFKVAGASVAIVKDGKVVYEKGFGVRSITTKIAGG